MSKNYNQWILELFVGNKFDWKLKFLVPVMRVMDGFGRNLADQFYKAGSSLEIVCEVINFINYTSSQTSCHWIEILQTRKYPLSF